MSKERISSSIPKELNEQLSAKAKELGIPKSELIAKCVDQHLTSVSALREELDDRISGNQGLVEMLNTAEGEIKSLSTSLESMATEVDRLFSRNWFQRLFNMTPWIKKDSERLWDTPAPPITPTPDTPAEKDD